MYTLLDQASQQAISQENFVKRYRNAMNALTLSEIQYDILSDTTTPNSARVGFRVTYKTNLIGALQREMSADFNLENGQWKITWNDGLVLPELLGGNYLSLEYDAPARGIIYDNKGNALVTQTDAYSLAVVPSQILPDEEPTLVNELARLTGLYPGAVMSLYEANRNTDWYTPIGEAPAKEIDSRWGLLSRLGGLALNKYTARYYFDGGIAPQAVGYVSPIQPEDLDTYLRQGYSPASRVGRIGIEQWGEQYLAGKTGVTLYLFSADGKPISQLAKSDPQLPGSITLTIDKNLQYQAQKAITGFLGSIVVMERDTGRILAIASSPSYNPNLFDPNNANSGYALGALVNDPNRPLYDRATKGEYPLGSVFKVITFSAALESGTYTPDSKYNCQYEFTELSDRTLYDWTWEHMQSEIRAGEEPPYTQPSGELTLTGGLMRSCNPYFYHIGRDLYLQGRVSAVADMARGFGLGKPTGIGQVEENAGTIKNPTTELEATNQAIGQGDVLVTPLQVARFMAAIGNGGTLYRPQIVEKTADPVGNVTQLFKPESGGVLPMKPETLAALRFAMREVVKNPRGTAYIRFTNIDIPIYGKTGTAESSIPGSPHAWFAGYTDAQIEGVPDIAIAVIAENAGEGSQISAPIFKRIVEVYFFGRPLSPYRWETSIGVTRTPTPPVSPTPGE